MRLAEKICKSMPQPGKQTCDPDTALGPAGHAQKRRTACTPSARPRNRMEAQTRHRWGGVGPAAARAAGPVDRAACWPPSGCSGHAATVERRVAARPGMWKPAAARALPTRAPPFFARVLGKFVVAGQPISVSPDTWWPMSCRGRRSTRCGGASEIQEAHAARATFEISCSRHATTTISTCNAT